MKKLTILIVLFFLSFSTQAQTLAKVSDSLKKAYVLINAYRTKQLKDSSAILTLQAQNLTYNKRITSLEASTIFLDLGQFDTLGTASIKKSFYNPQRLDSLSLFDKRIRSIELYRDSVTRVLQVGDNNLSELARNQADITVAQTKADLIIVEKLAAIKDFYDGLITITQLVAKLQ